MKFGVREICDVTFKTTANNQRVGKTVFAKAGMPAFMIDTAKTSSLEQATSTSYANGGKGNSRLIAWEGEKTMTFTVEDALISPMGLAVLSGAGIIESAAKAGKHVHVTLDVATNANGAAEVTLDQLKEETGIEDNTILVCSDVPVYATVLDGSGAGIEFVTEEITISGGAEDAPNEDVVAVDAENAVTFTAANHKSKTLRLDFYLLVFNGVTEVEVKPEDFGGYFYVEAQTLFRREDNGKDMAAEIILPKVKVQSGFTFTMAATGDPSTFTFTMDAFPSYTKFDKTKKVMCVIQMIGNDATASDDTEVHSAHTATV